MTAAKFCHDIVANDVYRNFSKVYYRVLVFYGHGLLLFVSKHTATLWDGHSQAHANQRACVCLDCVILTIADDV